MKTEILGITNREPGTVVRHISLLPSFPTQELPFSGGGWARSPPEMFVQLKLSYNATFPSKALHRVHQAPQSVPARHISETCIESSGVWREGIATQECKTSTQQQGLLPPMPRLRNGNSGMT